MVQLLDNYAASYSVLILALIESVVLAWVYGTSTSNDVIITERQRHVNDVTSNDVIDVPFVYQNLSFFRE
jgi:hypothetical protein